MLSAESEWPYERPAVSKQLLREPAFGEPPRIIAESAFKELNVDLRLGVAARAIDRTRHVIDCGEQGELPYARLLLATGSRSRQLPTDHEDADHVHYLRTIDDARRLTARLSAGSRLTVVGGGFIGLEVAAAAAKRGVQTTVIEAAPAILGRFAPIVAAEFVAEVHRRHGVRIRTGIQARSVVRSNDSWAVTLSDGGVLTSDELVVGIGILPETGLAVDAGLLVDDGIIVDEACRTSDPEIYAAGDCARQYHPLYGRHIRLEAWQNAQDQGLAAGAAMVGAEPASPVVPWAWSDQFDLNIQVAGLPDATLQTVVRREHDGDALSVFTLADGVVTGAITLNRGRDMPIVRRLIASRRRPDAQELADPDTPLRSLMS